MSIEIKENILLKDYTTFKIGGRARYFTVVKSLEEMKDAIIFSKKNRLPFFVLGGGSNILISDLGFSGLVIKNEIKKKVTVEASTDSSLVIFGSGENWNEAVEYSISKNLYGLENLSGIPGTVGASPVQNIGAYGQEIKNVMCSLKALDTETMEEKIFTNSDCRFSYRDSIFKIKENKKYIITEVSFLLKKNGQVNIGYKDLQLYFLIKGLLKPSLREVSDATIKIRREKFPDLKNNGLAGSFFKNVIMAEEEFNKLKENFPNLPGYEEPDKKVKVPLAWILDNICQLKGYRDGNVGLYDKQPIILVNYGGAMAVDVINFSEKIKKIVKEKTLLDIEWEVELVKFSN